MPRTIKSVIFSISVVIFLLCQTNSSAQVVDIDTSPKISINGQLFSYVVEGKDTLILASLDAINVTLPRNFANDEERKRYLKLRRSAGRVYPYATEAVQLYREVQEETANLKKRKKRRHIKDIQNEYKDVFENQLKKLTKTDGKVLIKMIERELDVPFHSLIKELRGGFQAFYWHQFAKMYGYDLKEGYEPKQDPLLDAVLNDYPIPKKYDKD